jgi:hypothetical protein
MLNGIDPIIIFHFYSNPPTDDKFVGPPPPTSLLGGLFSQFGLPIPIYLSEKLTGIYVDDESKGIDIATRVDAVVEKDGIEVNTPEVSQRAVDSTVTVNMFAVKDSIMLTAFLALADMILKRVASKEYGITYLNGSTTIFNGLLDRFSYTNGANDNLIRIEMVLSNAKKQAPTLVPSVPPITPVVGAIPL